MRLTGFRIEVGNAMTDGTGRWENGEACDHCGLRPNAEHMTHKNEYADPCLGVLPGVRFACCGHGNPRGAYVMFENRVVVRGFTLVQGEGVTLWANGEVEHTDTRSGGMSIKEEHAP